MSFKRSSGDEAIRLYIGNKGLKPLVLECSNRVVTKHVTKHGRVALTPFNVIQEK